MEAITTMPFGKYQGVEIKELETPYISFCLEQFNLRNELRFALVTELDQRLNLSDSLDRSKALKDDLSQIYALLDIDEVKRSTELLRDLLKSL